MANETQLKSFQDAAAQRVREQRERAMYGATIEAIKSANSMTIYTDPLSVNLLAMSILSDAQAVLEFEQDAEKARQYINRAKYFMSHVSEMVHPANRKAA